LGLGGGRGGTKPSVTKEENWVRYPRKKSYGKEGVFHHGGGQRFPRGGKLYSSDRVKTQTGEEGRRATG